MVVEGIGIIVVGEDHVGVGQSRRPRLRSIDRGAGRVVLPMASRAALRGHCGQLIGGLGGAKGVRMADLEAKAGQWPIVRGSEYLTRVGTADRLCLLSSWNQGDG